MLFKTKSYYLYQNNNSLIVIDQKKETKDVMVVGWILPLSMLKLIQYLKKLSILILVLMTNAMTLNQAFLLQLQAMKMFRRIALMLLLKL